MFHLSLQVDMGGAANLLRLPQHLKTLRMRAEAKTVLKSTPLMSAILAAQRRLCQGGRALVRKSGTEPVIRVLVECDDPYLVRDVIEPASSQGPAPRAGRPRPV
jgi:phosphoglucosamine mutase